MEVQTKGGWVRLFSVDILIAASLCLLSVMGFTFIAREIVVDQQDLFDSAAFRFFEAHTTVANTRAALFITFFGSGYFLFPAYIVIALYLFIRKKPKRALIIMAIATVSMVLGNVLKSIFQRNRPPLEHLDAVSGYSFPSGHSLAAFTFGGIMITVVWLTGWKATTRWLVSFLLFLFACLIALSRIYLHVHYASDVVGGFCVTIIWLSICFVIFSWDGKRWLV